ncbi:MAG: hypothetical protein FJ245_07790 [Nitrospira sp.]|nr:hypothetical protein [Nitrospira sp.]
MIGLDKRRLLRLNSSLAVLTAVSIANGLLSAACAPVGTIKVEVAAASGPNVYLVDARPVRWFSWDYLGAGVAAHRLSDGSFDPDPMTVMSRVFQEKLSQRLEGKTIIVTRFLVSLVDVGASSQSLGLPGEALGSAVVDLAVRINYGWMIFCEFEASLDGETFKAVETTRTDKSKVEEGVNKVIKKALDTAARAMNARFAYQF